MKSCLTSIPLFYLLVFKIPIVVENKLESGTSGSRCHLVNWDLVCRPKVEGGLGVRRLPLKNKALVNGCGNFLFNLVRCAMK